MIFKLIFCIYYFKLLYTLSVLALESVASFTKFGIQYLGKRYLQDLDCSFTKLLQNKYVVK